jgi:ubiquinone/menaquinone biosynthesis C-methylase UbiE
VTSLDAADLVAIAGRVLGIKTGAALEQVDTQADATALAEAPAPLALPDHDLARITYDDDTAAAYTQVRGIPRDGLGRWRDAIQRHLNPVPGMTMVDIGAGTGTFSAAFSDWFGLSVFAVEPSAAMRARIPRQPGIEVSGGDASALPLPDGSADGAWLSLVLHHIPDLEAAAREIRRVLRPGAPVLIRQGFPDRPGWADTWWVHHWFPETTRTVATWPTVARTCQAFAAAGFSRDGLEQVPETYRTTLAEFLAQVDTFRRADSPMRSLTEEEFRRGKERLRRAARDAEQTAPSPEPRTSLADLLVLR